MERGWCEGWVGGWVDRKGVYGDLSLEGDAQGAFRVQRRVCGLGLECLFLLR